MDQEVWQWLQALTGSDVVAWLEGLDGPRFAQLVAQRPNALVTIARYRPGALASTLDLPPARVAEVATPEQEAALYLQHRHTAEVAAPSAAGSGVPPQAPSAGDEPGRQLPTFDEIKACFTEAREYYKGQVKSSNKVYSADTANPKKDRRNRNARIASEQRNITFMRQISSKALAEIGKDIVEQNVRIGNCFEMSCVAAYIIERRFPNATVHSPQVTPPGDHGLLVVGDIPGTAPINSWRDLPDTFNAYAVDVWLAICCDIREYPDAVVEKLQEWEREDKRVITAAPPGSARRIMVNSPSSPQYIDSILARPIVVHLNGRFQSAHGASSALRA
jgi:hypothetical protein